MKLAHALLTMVLALGAIGAVQAQGGASGDSRTQPTPTLLEPGTPRYELELSMLEFSVLHGSGASGVAKYGGDIAFEVALARVDGELVTLVSLEQERLIDVWSYYMAERTADFLALADIDRLDEATSVALKTARSVNSKLAAARARPIWEPIELTGLLSQEDGSWYLQSERGRCSLLGEAVAELTGMAGRELIATGLCRVRGELELTHFVERKRNTLELVVMSHCPFAKQAQRALIERLRDGPPASPPVQLEVRYVFYARAAPGEGDTPGFWCMHGEPELEENLVQMAIRELYPDAFLEYVLRRAMSEEGWRDLAQEVGLDADAQAMLAEWIDVEGEAAIRAEHAYVAGRHGILDGSPTYIFEGRRLAELREVPAFAGLGHSSTCARADELPEK